MLRRLEAALRDSSRVRSIEVIDNDPVDADNFLFKVRCELATGQSLQMRIRSLDGDLRYSYQEFTDRPLRRWDNAPHFPQLDNFPHHYHDIAGIVTGSSLIGDPMSDLEQVLQVL